MVTYKDIAKRIAKIILSPDSAIGFAHGVLSVPLDAGYLAYSYFDTSSRYIRETERIRLVRAIRFGVLHNSSFTNTIEIVLNYFNKYIPEAKRDSIYTKISTSVIGRATTNAIISKKLATAIAQRSSMIISLRGGFIGNVILAGGMAERSIYTSQRLELTDPEIYFLLRQRDYDFLFFLIEPVLNPFLEALRIRKRHGHNAFHQILEIIEREVANA